jgi:predicted aspartyl protease
MSLVVDVEIESTDTAVKRCTQALIDCGATGCFIDIEWAKLNNVPAHPLTKPIPVYNVDGTANDAGAITDIADVILRYENHSERTQLAVTRLGKQSLILGYNWLHNHNPEINWQKKTRMNPLTWTRMRLMRRCRTQVRPLMTTLIVTSSTSLLRRMTASS